MISANTFKFQKKIKKSFIQYMKIKDNLKHGSSFGQKEARDTYELKTSTS